LIFRITSIAALAALSCGTALLADGGGEHCHGRGSSIVIDVDAHTLRLCDQDRAVRMHRVALGRGGVDKKERGDRKTPLGVYTLGAPRVSTRFGTFIPVGYPTAEQKKEGYTGSAIGIHGPDRRFRWLGRLTTWVDWTAGCIAVGRDEDIENVARWIKLRGVTKIIIESHR
jgi:L,D-peptidoglycan transpeptidase YkuD (ErfK/YbiS/YcfS/YnhG family)